jgi:hypothetical protein
MRVREERRGLRELRHGDAPIVCRLQRGQHQLLQKDSKARWQLRVVAYAINKVSSPSYRGQVFTDERT